MIQKRIIPCLDVRDGRVVKGVNFQGAEGRILARRPGHLVLRKRGGRARILRHHRLRRRPGIFTGILRETAERSYTLTVGGGISSLDDFDRVLKAGADKVSVNSAAIRDPELIARRRPALRQPVRCAERGHQAGKRRVHGLRQGRTRGHRHARARLDSAGRVSRRGRGWS